MKPPAQLAEREPATPAALPSMTPDRWRAVDGILQAALERERHHRDAFVRETCGDDEALYREVVSLLAAHDTTPEDFLERPVIEALGLAEPVGAPPRPVFRESDRNPSPTPRAELPPSAASHSVVEPAPAASLPGRTVSARVAVYAAALSFVIGGSFARSSIVQRWTNRKEVAALWQPSTTTIRENVSGASTAGLSLVLVDRSGRLDRSIAAERPWTPRFSPDGHRVAYGAFGTGKTTSDVWITDLDAGTTRRLTDDDADSNDPQWSPDGKVLAYSVSAPGGKDVAEVRLADGKTQVLASRPGNQFPSDWLHDGSALLVTDDAGAGRHDVVVQPADGSAARPYVATGADETAGRVSPDGRWIAYRSDESGRAEVYVDSYPRAGRRVMISRDGGADPVWRADGRELYYWRDDALVAVKLGSSRGDAPPSAGEEIELFRAPYEKGINTMYDVSPDGGRFVIVERR